MDAQIFKTEKSVKKMDKEKILKIVVSTLLLIIISSFSGYYISDYLRPQIAVVYILGTIDPSNTDGWIINTLEGLKNNRVAAVVLRMNTPGGSPSAAYDVYNEIMKLRKAGKKVVVSMSEMGASAGYYIASSADEIMATPQTCTGSIGVIMTNESLQGLYNKLGKEVQIIRTGKYKAAGIEETPWTPEQITYYKKLVDVSLQDFINAVAKGRKLKVEEVRQLADGRIFDGMEAKRLHLIDEIGNLQDAIQLAAKISKAKNYKVTYPGIENVTSSNKKNSNESANSGTAELYTVLNGLIKSANAESKKNFINW